MNRTIKNKQLLIIVISLILLIVGSTFAWFIWSSNNNTNINLTVGAVASVNYIDGQNINVTNIGPVLDYNDGESTTFSVTKRIDGNVYTTAYLTITSLPIELKTASFKCKILTSTDNINYTEYDEIDFSNKEINTKYVIVDLDINNIRTKYYKVVFYIDGNMEQDIAMMNKTFTATITTEATNGITDFVYTGNYQEYVVPKTGYYQIEAWGASGNNDYNEYTASNPSYGGYTKGTILLEKNERIYLYVGGMKQTFNCCTSQGNAVGSGGATDIRLVAGNWNDISSQLSRIMVAGGAGASYHDSTGPGGGSAGGLISKAVYHATDPIASATQTYGGAAGRTGTAGTFGAGGINSTYYYNSGGGGYYGGGGGPASGGGSSYISGYAGVNSVDNNTTITHNNNTIHYSNKYFIDTKMQGGIHDGNGKAKITYIGDEPEKTNNLLNNVKYIKDCIIGNKENKWIEIQAIVNGKNIAKTNTTNITGTVIANTNKPYSNIIDGDILPSSYGQANTT